MHPDKHLREGGDIEIEDPELLPFADEEKETLQPELTPPIQDPDEDALGLGLHRAHPQGAEHLYKQAQLYVLDSVWRAEQDHPPDLKQGMSAVRRLRAFVEERETAMLRLALERGQDFSISAHSVNVAVIALRLAREMRWTPERCCRVGLAALLHEVGVAKLPKGLLYKRGDPTRSEMEALRGRPQTGADILKRAEGVWDWLPTWVGQVLERRDGSGFPHRIDSGRIAAESQLLAAADTFEAGVHRRPQRPPRTGHQMISELIADSPRFYCREVVRALLGAFTLYPLGEWVELNTGEKGVVIETRREHPSRPLVEIPREEEDGQGLPPKRVDLASCSNLHIRRALNRYAADRTSDPSS